MYALLKKQIVNACVHNLLISTSPPAPGSLQNASAVTLSP